MAIPNLLSLLLLSGVVAAETKKYLWNNNLNASITESEQARAAAETIS